jgi:hypothetical protein
MIAILPAYHQRIYLLALTQNAPARKKRRSLWSCSSANTRDAIVVVFFSVFVDLIEPSLSITPCNPAKEGYARGAQYRYKDT